MGNITYPPEKIIFLATNSWKLEDPVLLRLRRIVEGCPRSTIVLCSSWRIQEKYRHKARWYMKENGLPAFISCTIDTGRDWTDEIVHWLYTNTDFTEPGLEEAFHTLERRGSGSLPESEYLMREKLTGITHFIVIDNDQDYTTPFLLPHTVKLVTEDDVERAITLLSCLW